MDEDEENHHGSVYLFELTIIMVFLFSLKVLCTRSPPFGIDPEIKQTGKV